MERGDMTLHELCDTFCLSRRTVQWYEKHNLISPTGRNHMGHLLYNPEAQDRLLKIRQYQNFGFRVKDIGELLSLPNAELKQRLVIQKTFLEKKHYEIKENLLKLEFLIQSL